METTLVKDICPVVDARSSISPQSSISPPLARFDLSQKGSMSSTGHYSVSPHAPNLPENNSCKLVDYRGAKVASFVVGGRGMICLPQAFDLFLKHLVGGLHTVYTKLKRLEISPVVCNVEQVRILRGLGAIQPGVNRCKLLAPHDFDVLYEDCTSSSARPGRPPKRSGVYDAVVADADVSVKVSRKTAVFEAACNPNLEELKHTAALTAAYQRCSQQGFASAAAASLPFLTPYHPALMQQAAMSMALANRFSLTTTPASEKLAMRQAHYKDRHQQRRRASSTSSECSRSSDKESDGGSVSNTAQTLSPSDEELTSGIHNGGRLTGAPLCSSNNGNFRDSMTQQYRGKIVHKTVAVESVAASASYADRMLSTVRGNLEALLHTFDRHRKQLVNELDDLREAMAKESQAKVTAEKQLSSIEQERETYKRKYEKERDCRERLEEALKHASNGNHSQVLSYSAGLLPVLTSVVSRCSPGH